MKRSSQHTENDSASDESSSKMPRYDHTGRIPVYYIWKVRLGTTISIWDIVYLTNIYQLNTCLVLAIFLFSIHYPLRPCGLCCLFSSFSEDDAFDSDDYQILNYDDIDFAGIDHDVLADLEVR